jgi:thymidylate synthase (FAD)
MHCELINSMGDDLAVVNAARVSFDKESEWEWDVDYDQVPCGLEVKYLGEKDQKLISYLAKHNHWTPFSHVMITMRETVPIFVARQRFKHMVGFTYNEVSRRYVDDAPEFYVPTEWRGRAENAKQGSSNTVLFGEDVVGLIDYHNHCAGFYQDLLDSGVAPEQARIVLPQSMYTSYYVTGSLAAWARAYKLRSDPHAQKEIQDLAKQWNDIITNIPEMKYSWEALTKSD